MLFFRKTDETICKLPLSKRTLSFNQPPISEQFFHGIPLCLTFKNEIPPPPLILGGGGRKLCMEVNVNNVTSQFNIKQNAFKSNQQNQINLMVLFSSIGIILFHLFF